MKYVKWLDSNDKISQIPGSMSKLCEMTRTQGQNKWNDQIAGTKFVTCSGYGWIFEEIWPDFCQIVDRIASIVKR